MKAAVVSFSTLTKHRRWDADFYLGMVDGREHKEKIKQRQAQLRSLRQGLRTLRAQAQAHKARVAAMIAAGEIVPLTKRGKPRRKRK